MFDSTKASLSTLLGQVHENKLQLPDFQRDWVWDDEAIRSLLASILRGFPVGAILTLSTGGEVRFLARPLESAPKAGIEPDEFLLDGQQRLTSLYQTLYSQTPVSTKTQKGQKIERYYFLDIRKALEETDFEEAIVGLPADGIERENFGRDIKRDLSTDEAQYAAHMFPMNRTLDPMMWILGWHNHWSSRGESIQTLSDSFARRIVEPVKQYQMPIIRLTKENTREAICLVFEKGIAPDQLDTILRSHLIDPDHLRADDFDAFWTARRRALSDMIAEAMKKRVVEESGANEPMGEPEEDPDEEIAA